MGGAVFVGTLQLQHDLAGAIAFEPFVGDGRPGDIAAEVLEFCTLIGAPAHRRMEAKAVRVDTQLWGGRPGCARQRQQAECAALFRPTLADEQASRISGELYRAPPDSLSECTWARPAYRPDNQPGHVVQSRHGRDPAVP